MLLDELKEIRAEDAGATAYMLANGQGKTRAGRSGEARRPVRWRVLFLSAGELGLADKIAEDGRGRRAAAGQEVRVVDIPADAGAGLGIFEALQGAPSADAFARALKEATAARHGHAGSAFLDCLTRDVATVEPVVRQCVAEFLAEVSPPGADGQVSRVAARFALVAAAGELARAYGVLPWGEHVASSAATRCYMDWLSARGGIEPAEEREAVATVRRFIEAHGTSRFEPMGELARTDDADALRERTINRVGFRRRCANGGVEYLVLPEAWKSDVCIGQDPVAVARALLKRGLLVPGSGGRVQNLQRLPGFPTPVRCYLIRRRSSGIRLLEPPVSLRSLLRRACNYQTE